MAESSQNGKIGTSLERSLCLSGETCKGVTVAQPGRANNLVVVVGLPALGIMLAYVAHRLDRKAPAYLGNFTKDVRSASSVTASRLDIHAVKEMVDDDNPTEAKRVPLPNRNTLLVTWPVFIRICEDADEAANASRRHEWGHKFTNEINFFAQKNFDYASNFEFGMDLTSEEASTNGGKRGSLADFLAFDDTLDVMINNYYEGMGKGSVTNNEEAMLMFFGQKHTAAMEYFGRGQKVAKDATLEDLKLEDL